MAKRRNTVWYAIAAPELSGMDPLELLDMLRYADSRVHDVFQPGWSKGLAMVLFELLDGYDWTFGRIAERWVSFGAHPILLRTDHAGLADTDNVRSTLSYDVTYHMEQVRRWAERMAEANR
jgi:hypothetical protein